MKKVKQNHKYYDILSKSQRSSGVEQRFRNDQFSIVQSSQSIFKRCDHLWFAVI